MSVKIHSLIHCTNFILNRTCMQLVAMHFSVFNGCRMFLLVTTRAFLIPRSKLHFLK